MNENIFHLLNNLTHQSALVDNIIIFLAAYFQYIVIWLAAMFLLFHHDVFKAENPFRVFLQKKKEIIFSFWVSALAWVIARILKLMIHVDRPFIAFQDVQAIVRETGGAFPSGHATFFMALAVSIFLTHKKAGYVFMIFALIIGLARVASGVHSPIDILGGFALGAFIAYLVAYLVKRI